MKTIDLQGITNMELVRGGTDEWYWSTDYREETVVRSVRDGSILDRYPGDIRIMPDGNYYGYTEKQGTASCGSISLLL